MHRPRRFNQIITSPSPYSGRAQREENPFELVNIFPSTDGFLFEAGRLIKSYFDEQWLPEKLKDFYLTHINNERQVLLLVSSGVSAEDIAARSRSLWPQIQAFILTDQIYVIEREKIGIFQFNPRDVIEFYTFREYAVPGLRHCRLVGQDDVAGLLGPGRLLPYPDPTFMYM